MKILQVIPQLHGGGAEKFCIDISNEMSHRHEVIICSFYNISEEMFMVKALDKKIKIITLNKQQGFQFSLFFKLYKLIKDEKVDIVHLHLRTLIYSILGIFFTKSKFFYTIHSLASSESSKKSRRIYGVLFNYFSVTPIAISKQVKKSMQQEYGRKFNTLINNGVSKPSKTDQLTETEEEIKKYKQNPKTKVFLSVGRIDTLKNHEMLIEVFNNLIQNNENIILLIIGDDYTKEQKLKQKLIQLAGKHIHFLGMKKNVSDYLLCVDAFCLTSLIEGLPITLLEALATSTIPICTPAGGIVDVLNTNIGFLSSNFTKEAYEKEVKRFLDLNEQQLKALKENAYKAYLKNYDIKNTANKYLHLYQEKKEG